MIRPREMTPEEKELNDRIWEKRIKYPDFDYEYDDDLEIVIVDSLPADFKTITNEFSDRMEYIKAVHTVMHCIDFGLEPSSELVKRIRKTIEQFRKAYPDYKSWDIYDEQ